MKATLASVLAALLMAVPALAGETPAHTGTPSAQAKAEGSGSSKAKKKSHRQAKSHGGKVSAAAGQEKQAEPTR